MQVPLPLKRCVRPAESLTTRYERLRRRLDRIDEQVAAERGTSLFWLGGGQEGPASDRLESLLRRMEVIDAALVAIERVLPDND